MESIKGKKYFSHDADAHNDPKIRQLLAVYGWAGYGRYFRLIEQLTAEDNHRLNMKGKYFYEGVGQMLNMSSPDAERFVIDCIDEFKLFEGDGEYMWSVSHLERMKMVDDKSEVTRKAAHASLVKRGLTTESYEQWSANKVSKKSTDAQQMEERLLSNINRNRNRNIKLKNSFYLYNPSVPDEALPPELEFQSHEFFTDEIFYQTWNEYMTIKDEKKHQAWSATQMKAQWNKLIKYSDGKLDKAKKMLTKARDGGWKGLWEVDEDAVMNKSAAPIKKGKLNDAYDEVDKKIEDEFRKRNS